MKNLTKTKKYTAILDAAKVLFWKYGYRRVTIDEICSEAKTSKMTFYKYFPNKLEVARAVFDKVTEDGLIRFREILTENSTPSVKMKNILQLKLEGTNNISNEFLNDFYNNPELGLAPYIEAKTKILWKETLELFRGGQKDGWIRADMNVEFMFSFMQRSASLLTDTEVLKLFNSPQDLIMELANMFVYGISPLEK
ncbi:MAG: TetR/AcrR family transcriptional regulator [Bacteroidetes bacterium]|nr:TetR/AcrR family transcriptional regulator [Bacteroidota bacterium]